MRIKFVFLVIFSVCFILREASGSLEKTDEKIQQESSIENELGRRLSKRDSTKSPDSEKMKNDVDLTKIPVVGDLLKPLKEASSQLPLPKEMQKATEQISKIPILGSLVSPPAPNGATTRDLQLPLFPDISGIIPDIKGIDGLPSLKDIIVGVRSFQGPADPISNLPEPTLPDLPLPPLSNLPGATTRDLQLPLFPDISGIIPDLKGVPGFNPLADLIETLRSLEGRANPNSNALDATGEATKQSGQAATQPNEALIGGAVPNTGAGLNNGSSQPEVENVQNLINKLSDLIGQPRPIPVSPNNPPSTNPPSTNPPSTNPPSTNPPPTNPPSTNPPPTNPPPTNPSPTNPSVKPSPTGPSPAESDLISVVNQILSIILENLIEILKGSSITGYTKAAYFNPHTNVVVIEIQLCGTGNVCIPSPTDNLPYPQPNEYPVYYSTTKPITFPSPKLSTQVNKSKKYGSKLDYSKPTYQEYYYY